MRRVHVPRTVPGGDADAQSRWMREGGERRTSANQAERRAASVERRATSPRPSPRPRPSTKNGIKNGIRREWESEGPRRKGVARCGRNRVGWGEQGWGTVAVAAAAAVAVVAAAGWGGASSGGVRASAVGEVGEVGEVDLVDSVDSVDLVGVGASRQRPTIEARRGRRGEGRPSPGGGGRDRGR